MDQCLARSEDQKLSISALGSSTGLQLSLTASGSSANVAKLRLGTILNGAETYSLYPFPVLK